MKWKMREVTHPPKWPPFQEVHPQFLEALAVTSVPGLLAAALPLPKVYSSGVSVGAGIVAGISYVAGYRAFLGIGIEDSYAATRPKVAAVCITLGQLLAGLTGDSTKSRLRSVFASAVSMWIMVYTSTKGTSRLCADGTRSLRDTIKEANHWAQYSHPSPRSLLVNAGLVGGTIFVRSAGGIGFTTAVFLVECRLFLKSRRRQIVKLDAHSTSIIQSQADLQDLTIPEYSKKYIAMMTDSPLVIDGDDLYWKLCTNETVPCFVHNYVDMLGINTPPCCAQHMSDLAKAAHIILKKNGYEHWLDGGSLLGAVRHSGKTLPWEDDVDIAYLVTRECPYVLPNSDIANTMEKQFSEYGYTFTVSDQGNIHVYHTNSNDSLFPFEFLRRTPLRSVHLDIVPFKEDTSDEDNPILYRKTIHKLKNGQYVEKRKDWRRSDVFPLSEVTFGGSAIPAPYNSDAYLTVLYKDWREISYQYLTHLPVRRVRRKVDEQHLDVKGFKEQGWGGTETTCDCDSPISPISRQMPSSV
eukprot:TRINITY_DN3353_c0_g1_i1.p1 TRINITY_DN3353_c0_g1~~TRINITY_DN3353_c0_g1_i1.p1  ORF type:complete len:524 (+),score=67.77 TRINITY_DN3353_c0_g1_i1:511-2082(+)